MTDRERLDRFAAKAMAVFLDHECQDTTRQQGITNERAKIIVSDAYHMASLMLDMSDTYYVDDE